MTLPAGQPIFDRVVMTMAEPLQEALETELVGYAEVVPQAGLLGESPGRCRVWFEDGVPVGATHTGSGRTAAAYQSASSGGTGARTNGGPVELMGGRCGWPLRKRSFVPAKVDGF
ncbi:MAG: hypothetical protein ACOCZC_02100 [Halodesulfurarchaeum sp.]